MRCRIEHRKNRKCAARPDANNNGPSVKIAHSIPMFGLLLLLGCGQGRQKVDSTPDSGETNQTESTSIATSRTVSVIGMVTNKVPELSDLPDESQVKVVACDYVVRQVLEHREEIVAFVTLSDNERLVLAARRPRYKLRPDDYAKATSDIDIFRDEESKEIGCKLEVTALEIRGREAIAIVMWGGSSIFDFELEKANGWRIRRVSKSAF